MVSGEYKDIPSEYTFCGPPPKYSSVFIAKIEDAPGAVEDGHGVGSGVASCSANVEVHREMSNHLVGAANAAVEVVGEEGKNEQRVDEETREAAKD